MRSVYREYSVQVVDLMLQQLRAVAFELGFMGLAPEVVVPHANAVGAENTHQQVGEGEAVIPHREVLVPDIDDLGIDEHPGLFHLDVYEPEWRADLRGSDAAPTAKSGLPVAQRVGEVVDHDADRRRLRIGDQLAAFTKDGIAQEANSADSHGAKVGPVEHAVNYPVKRNGDMEISKTFVINILRAFHRSMTVSTVLLASGLAACSDNTGGSTATSAISPDFSVSAAPNSITFVYGRLQAEGFASVRLPDSDALIATAGGQVKQLRWTVDPLGTGRYAASLTQLDAGTVITIALSRGDGGDAPNSQVTMPAALGVTAPLAGASVTAGDNLLVSWVPSGTPDQMQVVMRAVRCTRSGAGSTISTTVAGDPGSATVAVDPSLLPPLASGEQCEVDVQVQRVIHGTVDPAYAGGTIEARQLDAVRIVVLEP